MIDRLNIEQLEAMCDWLDLQEWEADPDQDMKPPWMREPCPAPAEGRWNVER